MGNMPSVEEVAAFPIFGSIYIILNLFQTQKKSHFML